VYKKSTRTKHKPPARRASARTNIVLDPTLVARVKRIAGVSTTREAVNIALDHYARSRDSSQILALFGTEGVAADYDPKMTNPPDRR
jgi:Arc/MetJ family transcription regulator